MKVFLVSRRDEHDYDQYDSFVCVAADEDAARNTTPDGYDWGQQWGSWIHQSDVGRLKVEEIAFNPIDSTPRVILASFNAG